MKPILNKWQFHFNFSRSYNHFELGWKNISFGIFKIHTRPEEGCKLQRKNNYKGFLISFYIWLPFDKE